MHKLTRKIKRRQFNIDIESMLRIPNNLGVFWKNLDGYYQGCNDSEASMLDFKSRHDIDGMTDFDLPIHQEEATLIHDNDVKVIRACQPIQFHQAVTLPSKKLEFITIKMPLYNNDGNMVGVFGIDNFININTVTNTLPLLAEANVPINQMRIVKYNNKINNTKLSPRQAECVYYLTKGMTAKQIAEKLKLSQRTIESHIAAIKIKLNCQRRSDIIMKYFN